MHKNDALQQGTDLENHLHFRIDNPAFMKVADNYFFTKIFKICLIEIISWESLVSVHKTVVSHMWTRDELNYCFN